MTDDFYRNGKEEADNRLLASMSPEGRERARRINAINGGYIVTKRHHDICAFVDRIIENAAAACMGPANKLRVGMVLGPSGSGKTTTIEQVFAMRPEFQPYESNIGVTFDPVLRYDAPTPAQLIPLLKERVSTTWACPTPRTLPRTTCNGISRSRSSTAERSSWRWTRCSTRSVETVATRSTSHGTC